MFYKLYLLKSTISLKYIEYKYECIKVYYLSSNNTRREGKDCYNRLVYKLSYVQLCLRSNCR